MLVRIEDTLTGQSEEIPTDLVVLSTALEPSEGTNEVAKILKVGQTEDNFIKEKHSRAFDIRIYISR